MIYLFTGNSDYLVREKTLAWKKLFIEKNGDFNLIHFQNLYEIDNNQIHENILAEGFMGEKKLIIIDGFPLSGTDKNGTNNKKQIITEKQDFLHSIIKQIPINNIVIFSSSNPDKRGKFYKELKKIATKVEEFNSNGEQDSHNIVMKKYGNFIDSNALNLLLKYKGGNIEKSISEIRKLLITKEQISSQDIQNHIKPELEESIFQLLDDILNVNIKNAFKKIDIILDDINIYAFYNNLLANLRTSVYISQLKSMGFSGGEISSHLQLANRSFLANKSYKIQNVSLKKLYISLINLDKKMKSGKLLGTTEEDLQFEIEKVIIGCVK